MQRHETESAAARGGRRPLLTSCLVLSIFLLLTAGAVSATVTVTVATPADGATVCSPVRIAASATTDAPGQVVTGWWIYVDSVGVYNNNGPTSSIDTNVTMAAGDHQVIVRAWDGSGAFGSQVMTLHVQQASSCGGVSVNVTSPAAGSTAASPVRFTASAASANPITGFVVYVDDVNVYRNYTSTLDAWVILTFGPHNVYVRAWDSTGAYGTSAAFTLDVQGAAIPMPLAGAVTVSNIDDDTTPPNYQHGWGSCTDCAGGQALATSWPMTQSVASPSRDGASTNFTIEGPPNADALWWNKLGPRDGMTNFLWDFWFYVPNSVSTANATEFDLFQATTIGGAMKKFMFGTQCDHTRPDANHDPTWDTWNETTGQWVNQPALPCVFTPNTWHHLVYFVQRIGDNRDTVLYGNVTLDGVTTQWNVSAPSAATSWASVVGVQFQLDIGGSGTTLQEWIDQVTVTMW